MNATHTDLSRRPIVGRISVIVSQLRPGLVGWSIEDAQNEKHKELIGLEPEFDSAECFPVSTVRAGVKPGDFHDVLFHPSGEKEPLLAGGGYVLLISTMPDSEPDDFRVLGFTPADVFMKTLKQFKDHKEKPRQIERQKTGFVRKETPVVQEVDHQTIYRLKRKGDDPQFSGTVLSIANQAMRTFGSEWRKEIRTYHWFKKEGLRYSNTPSKRPELPIDNQMAMNIGNLAKEMNLAPA